MYIVVRVTYKAPARAVDVICALPPRAQVRGYAAVAAAHITAQVTTATLPQLHDLRTFLISSAAQCQQFDAEICNSLLSIKLKVS